MMRCLTALLALFLATTACRGQIIPDIKVKWDSKEVAQAQSLLAATWLGKQDYFSRQLANAFWEAWKSYYDQQLAAGRQLIFEGNLAKIVNYNLNKLPGGLDPTGTLFFQSPNPFSALTYAEFKAQFLGSRRKVRRPTKAAAAAATGGASGGRRLLQAPLPSKVDWSAEKKISAVKKQDKCGACWAFATLSALESAQLMKNGKLLDLSEQQLIDCVNKDLGYQSKGCSGGWPTDALSYIQRFNVTTEARYPYKKGTQTCRMSVLRSSKNKDVVKLTSKPGFTVIPGLSALALQAAVAKQPVIIAFNLESSFQNYGGGVYPASACGATTVNHAMLVTGYDAVNKFFIIKNSFGTDWGEDGFARVEMVEEGLGTCAMHYYKYHVKT